jgi:hypothetical protein
MLIIIFLSLRRERLGEGDDYYLKVNFRVINGNTLSLRDTPLKRGKILK